MDLYSSMSSANIYLLLFGFALVLGIRLIGQVLENCRSTTSHDVVRRQDQRIILQVQHSQIRQVVQIQRKLDYTIIADVQLGQLSHVTHFGRQGRQLIVAHLEDDHFLQIPIASALVLRLCSVFAVQT